MLKKPERSGVIDGAFVVILGMILGAILLLVFQRYGESIEEKTSNRYRVLRSTMGGADIILDNGNDKPKRNW